jgi:hypothetical protein
VNRAVVARERVYIILDLNVSPGLEIPICKVALA